MNTISYNMKDISELYTEYQYIARNYYMYMYFNYPCYMVKCKWTNLLMGLRVFIHAVCFNLSADVRLFLAGSTVQ